MNDLRNIAFIGSLLEQHGFRLMAVIGTKGMRSALTAVYRWPALAGWSFSLTYDETDYTALLIPNANADLSEAQALAHALVFPRLQNLQDCRRQIQSWLRIVSTMDVGTSQPAPLYGGKQQIVTQEWLERYFPAHVDVLAM